MRNFFKLLFLMVLLSGCSSDDVDCVTGPVGFTFEVVEETTGENLFGNSQFEDSQINIENSEGQEVEFLYQYERHTFLITLGWESKSDIYTVFIGDEIEFDIVFTLNTSNSKPCSSTSLTELEIEGATFETSNTTGVTTIFVTGQVN